MTNVTASCHLQYHTITQSSFLLSKYIRGAWKRSTQATLQDHICPMLEWRKIIDTAVEINHCTSTSCKAKQNDNNSILYYLCAKGLGQ
jgi:hypothetical protein